MVNQFSASQGVLDRGTYVDLLNKAIDTLWMRRDNLQGMVLGQFFESVPVSSGLSHVISSVSDIVGLPRENEDTDALPYVQPAPGYDSTFNLVNYRAGIRVTDTLRRAQRFDRVVAMTGGLIKAAMRKMEYLRASVFNNAFATNTGADGSYLCADSHPHENPEAGTWDNNASASALSYASVQELRLLGMKMKNEMGYPDPVMVTKILVPPDKEQAAYEETRSKYVAGGSLNTETQLIGNMGIVVSPFITSSTAFFCIGDKMGEEKGLVEVTLMAPELADNAPANADIVIDKRVKFITKVGFTVSKNIYGNSGA